MATPRVSFGLQSDGSMRLRVSREGFDATDLTLDPRSVAFDSSFTVTPKIHKSAFVNLAAGSYDDDEWFRAASWPTLPFRPFLLVQFQLAGVSPLYREFTNTNIRARGEADGLYVRTRSGYDSAILLHYVALAVGAFDA